MKEIPEIPEHHSTVSHIMNAKQGTEYLPLKSLEEAKQHDDAIVVLEGDYGGIIYATCPVKHLKENITSQEISDLCKALERKYWGYGTSKVPDCIPQEGGWDVNYQRLAVGRGVWGGMGGGKVEDGLWIHSKLSDELVQRIRQILGQ